MINKRILSTLLALAILLSCVGWTPVQAQEAASVEENIDTAAQIADNSNISQFVDMEQFKQADHVARLRDEEKLNTYVFRNRDGSKSVYYMDQDVKFVDDGGTVREKDTTLVRGEKGYGMRSNDVGLHIPDSAVDGITVSHNSRDVKLTPNGGNVQAVVSDNSVIYSDFFGRGIHLKYTPMLSGVKEDVVITKYTGVNSFSFTLETGGLYLYETDGQYYLAVSEDAEAAFYLGEVLVYDAIGRPDLGTMMVETVVPSQRYKLTVSANEAFLTDPETLYPVTIDPTLTVSDNTHGAGAIEDAPVFDGKPTKNFGSYVYNTIGYHSESYGTAVTVVRLAGLLADETYAALTTSNISNVTFYMKDGGSSSSTVNIHAVATNSTWTESNVTWSNLGTYSSTVFATATMGSGSWGEFDITDLVKNWKKNTYAGRRGFAMVIGDSTKKVGTLSSEYSNTDYRPYVVVTYTGYELAVDEGSTLQLSSGMIGTVTWTSSDENLATVSSSGLVTGVKAGEVTITAACGDYGSSTYKVYVTKPDGVYYIQNASSGYCLEGKVGQTHINTQDTAADTRIDQLWKITYLQGGQYVIRPMQNLSKALTVNNSGYVAVADAATTDSAVTSVFRWSISYNANGYAVQQCGYSSETATPVVSGMPDSAVYAGTWSDNASCHWDFEKIEGVFLRDMDTLCTISYTAPIYVSIGQELSLEELQICIEATGNITTSSWNSSNTYVASVDVSTGTITINNKGTAQINLAASINGVNCNTYFKVHTADKLFFIDNYYESSFLTDARLFPKISDSVHFISKGYYDLFGVGFAVSGSPVLASNLNIDECTIDINQICTDTMCGTPCEEIHHKSRYRILNAVEGFARATNHISVLWSDRLSSSYCVVDSSTGIHRSTQAAAQASMETLATHIMGITGTDGKTIEDMHAYMGLVLAHEIAHNIGLGEINVIVDNHEVTGDFCCAMEAFEKTNNSHLELYENVLNGTAPLFCDYCQGLLETLIENVYVTD